MHDSNLYTDHEYIMNMLSRPLKESSKNIVEQDILEWCQQVETEFCTDIDNMHIFEGAEIPIINHRGRVPCHTFRILDVYSDLGVTSSRVPYKKNIQGGYLHFHPSLNLKKIYMDYVGTPIDMETGVPLIIKGHEQACYWFCMFNLFFNDRLTRRIDRDAWQEIKDNKENEILAARGTNYRHKDREDINRLDRITFSLIPRPAQLKLLSYGR
jgi:hypothetical protein